MTTEEMIAVMQHYANGGKIQVRAKCDLQTGHPGDWLDANTAPWWDWYRTEYRIKPAERRPREWQLVVDDGGRVHGGIPNKKGGLIEVDNPINLGQCGVVHVREVIE